jgi:hypothetical protein
MLEYGKHDDPSGAGSVSNVITFDNHFKPISCKPMKTNEKLDI